MNRVDIRELSVHVTFPCLSLIVRCTPQNYTEKIAAALEKAFVTLKNNVQDGFILQTVTKHIHTAQERLAPPEGTQTIAFYANKYAARVYYLPFECSETISIASMFVTKPLSNCLNRGQRYWVLFLHNNRPYLLEGYQFVLQEVIHHHNTFEGEQRYSMQDAAGVICDKEQSWGAHCRYTTPEEYIQKIDKKLQHFMESDTLPLVLIGVQKDVDWFLKHSKYKAAVIGKEIITDIIPVSELRDVAVSFVEKHYQQLQEKAFIALREAHEAGFIVQEMSELWHAAHADIIRLLIVDETFHDYACEDTRRGNILQKKECGIFPAIDPVDDIIELCISKGIPVHLVKNSELQKQGITGRIAAVVRD